MTKYQLETKYETKPDFDMTNNAQGLFKETPFRQLIIKLFGTKAYIYKSFKSVDGNGNEFHTRGYYYKGRYYEHGNQSTFFLDGFQ